MTINGSDEIASKESQGKPEARFLSVLSGAALIALLVGAVGSVGLMLRAGHRNPSRLLIVLFTFWVLSPFIALVLATWFRSVGRFLPERRSVSRCCSSRLAPWLFTVLMPSGP